MKSKIKTFLVIVATATIANIAYSQTPYDDFAPSETKKEMLKLPETTFRAVTNDTSSNVRYIEFDKESYVLKYLDKNNKLITQSQLNPSDFKWISVDPHASSYPGLSPYNYVGNMPIRAVDPDGKDIYILFYTSGNNRGDEMFRAAALTRQRDIQRSGTFDPAKDKVVVLAVQDMASIQKSVNNVVETYSAKYGQTAEFGIWSHAGTDGPTGTVPTSSYPLDEKQMTTEGWSQINFNWVNDGNGAKAGFYGCKTGVASDDKVSFATRISALSNFENVSVLGQTSSAYPSMYTNYRANSEQGSGNFILKETESTIYFSPTYMVGGIGRSQDWNLNEQNVALPMRTSQNGKGSVGGFQTGTTKNP